VADHFRNGHLPIFRASVDAIEELNKELAQVLGDGVVRITDDLRFARLIVQRGWEGLTTGTLIPTASETLKAARLLTEHSIGTAKLDQDALRKSVEYTLTIAQKHMHSRDFRRFKLEVTESEEAAGLKELSPRWPRIAYEEGYIGGSFSKRKRREPTEEKGVSIG